MRKQISIVTCCMAVIWIACCARPLKIENKACLCSEGWKCCEDTQVCVEEGESCGTAESSIKDDVKNASAQSNNGPSSDTQTEPEPGVEPDDLVDVGSKPAFSEDCGLEYCMPCSLDVMRSCECDPVMKVCMGCTKDADCPDSYDVEGEYCDLEDGLCKKERGSECWADWHCHHDEICATTPPFTVGKCKPLPQGTARVCSLAHVALETAPATAMVCKDSATARQCVRSDNGTDVVNIIEEQPCGAGMECVNQLREDIPMYFDPTQLVGRCREKMSCTTDDDCSVNLLDEVQSYQFPAGEMDPRLFCQGNTCVAAQRQCAHDDECPAALPDCAGIGLCVNHNTKCSKASDCASLDPAAVCVPRSNSHPLCGVALKPQGG